MPDSLVQKSLGPALGTCIHASLPGTQDVQFMVLGSSEFGHEGDTAESTVPRLGPLSLPPPRLSCHLQRGAFNLDLEASSGREFGSGS